MMLMCVGAGRLSLGIPARVRHGACLQWAMLLSHSLLLLAGLALGLLLVGHVATIKGLVSRPELDGILVLLEAMDFASGPWICRVKGGDTLRILPEKLVLVPVQDQGMAKLRYDSS